MTLFSLVRCYLSIFREEWLRHVLCFVYNVSSSRYNLFYSIISNSGHKRGKYVKDTENGFNRTIVGGLDLLPVLDRVGRCQGALPVRRPWVLSLLLM